jgi:hypothetical protein
MMRVTWTIGLFSFNGDHRDMMEVHQDVEDSEVMTLVESVTRLGFEPSVSIVETPLVSTGPMR